MQMREVFAAIERMIKAVRGQGLRDMVAMLNLASEDAGFITGQRYLVHGGMYFR